MPEAKIRPIRRSTLMGQRQRPRPKRLSEKLRQIRERLDLTQQEMAERLQHIESPPQPGHISEFENGRREPSLIYLLSVARMAGLQMERLVDDDLDLPKRLSGNASPERIMKRERTSQRR
jgi:transcriptional regulator with XRE-family HTH domain